MQKIPELNEYLEDQLASFQTITDPNLACDLLVKSYTEGILKYTKTVKPSRRRVPLKPWISPGILCSINRKNKLYKKYLQTSSDKHEKAYKKYRNTLTNVLREAKRLYFQNSFKACKGNSKETWKLLREATNSKKDPVHLPPSFVDDSNTVYSGEQVAKGFNDFFTSIGQQLDARIPSSSSSPTKYIKKVEYPSLNTLPSTNPLEIENIIQSLNPVGGGTDMISTKILLVTYKKIINHLTYFFNICLRNAIFPNRLKTALVIPVYKTGENNKFTNYRPISMLPIFSKILEKILYTHISSYLEEYSILQNCQFGFRKNHSTYMAMALIVDIITKALENREKVCGLYLDLKKAFDTVNIQILLDKLCLIGVQGSALEMLKSYLNNRLQRVRANGFVSEDNEITLGVPQGSILGPLLFLIYINDLPNISDSAKFFLFADDTAIIVKGSTYNDLQEQIDYLMPQLTGWFHSNKLTLNTSKTCFQLYSLIPSQEDIKVTINNTFIARSPSVKYLGIVFDENMKWQTQLNITMAKLSRLIGVMARTRCFLSSAELLLLYNSLILPHLNYCAAVWGSVYKIHLNKIVKLQKRAVRIIDNKPFLFPSNQLFAKYKILKFPDLVCEQNIMVLLAFLNGNLPTLVSVLFNLNRPLNIRATEHFAVPFTYHNFRSFSLSITAPRAWNSIVCPIFRQLKDVPRHKKTLKKYLRKHFIRRYRMS